MSIERCPTEICAQMRLIQIVCRGLSIVFCVQLTGCWIGAPESGFADRIIPAEEYSRSVKNGKAEEYSIFKIADPAEAAGAADIAKREQQAKVIDQADSRGMLADNNIVKVSDRIGGPLSEGDPRFISQGLKLRGSLAAPETEFAKEVTAMASAAQGTAQGYVPQQHAALLPPGSRSPYATGQMTANPSLWPDEAQSAQLFTDFRAFQAMDVITIVVNESSEGNKKTKTDTEGSYNLAAGIASFFGIETKKWKSNNEGINPEELIKATTETKFEGKGELNRSGNLKAQISAIVLEVLPNALLRLEGTKIVSVDNEEEVMVVSGLVRARDVTSGNQVDSNRVANMRIDFYGRGVLAQKQSPGWLARFFDSIWPF